jgi:hypothetical protein
MRNQKVFGFTKGEERYAVRYRNVKQLIDCLVDYAEDPRYNLDLIDVFILVHRLAYRHSKKIEKIKGVAPGSNAA